MFTKVCFLFTSRYSLLRLGTFSFTCAFLQPTDSYSVLMGAGKSTLLLCLLSLLCSSLFPCRSLWPSAFATVLMESLKREQATCKFKRINGINTSALQRYDTLFLHLFSTVHSTPRLKNLIAPKTVWPYRQKGMGMPLKRFAHTDFRCSACEEYRYRSPGQTRHGSETDSWLYYSFFALKNHTAKRQAEKLLCRQVLPGFPVPWNREQRKREPFQGLSPISVTVCFTSLSHYSIPVTAPSL